MPLAKKEPRVESSPEVHFIMCHCAAARPSHPTRSVSLFRRQDVFPGEFHPHYSLFLSLRSTLFLLPASPLGRTPPALHSLFTSSTSVSTPGSLASSLPSPAPGGLGSGGNLSPPVVFTSVPEFVSPETQIISRATVVPPVYNWDNFPKHQLGPGPGWACKMNQKQLVPRRRMEEVGQEWFHGH